MLLRCLRVRITVGVVLLGVAAWLLMPEGQAQTSKGKKYALLVGVNDYRSGKFPKLDFAENDAEELAKLLRQPGAGFTSVRVLTTTRGKKNASDAPTAENLTAALRELTADRGADDLVLVALSGHGVQLRVEDPDGKGAAKTYSYFCPQDASLLDVSYSTGRSKRLVNLSDVLDRLDNCDAGVKLLLMDACRNTLKPESTARRLDARRVTIPEGVAAVFSCKSGQISYESTRLKHGIFFYHVLQGLRGEAKNRRGEVTLSRLVEHVTEKVSTVESRQTPHPIVNIPGTSPVLVRLGDDPTQVALNELQGEWALTKLTLNGKAEDLTKIPLSKWTFEQDRLTWIMGKNPPVGSTIKLDARKNPRQIDIIAPEAVQFTGIYKIEKDELTICVTWDVRSRPTKFEDGELKGIVVLKRRK